MGGGLMQLVAYGAQDIYLTGNPQITFFKVVYRRHTNFAMESIEQTFNGTPGFGRKVSCTISRNGDLIHRCYLKVSLKNAVVVSGGVLSSPLEKNVVNFAGQALMKSVEVEIGGQRIDKHYSNWLHIWNELTQESGKVNGYNKMTSEGFTDADSEVTTYYVPLQFWFCRNPGLALPLIALQYHEVKINIEFASKTTIHEQGQAEPEFNTASLFVDYIYLDTDERRRFAQVSHEYLIEQLQFTGEESVVGGKTNLNVKLNFNHPCKELVWVVHNNGTDWHNFTNENKPSVVNGKLQLNGHDRFSLRDGAYFTHVQPYQHHSNVPENKSINVYSFGLKPEEHQPSGTCNMSRIDNATLQLQLSTGGGEKKMYVYATNYNVLRIMSGMGGLAYSN
jgi:hypothetical protein